MIKSFLLYGSNDPITQHPYTYAHTFHHRHKSPSYMYIHYRTTHPPYHHHHTFTLPPTPPLHNHHHHWYLPHKGCYVEDYTACKTLEEGGGWSPEGDGCLCMTNGEEKEGSPGLHCSPGGYYMNWSSRLRERSHPRGDEEKALDGFPP